MKNIDLSRLQDKYISKVKEFMYRNDLTKKDCAKRIGQHQSIFCDLLNNKRALSALYLMPALMGGIMDAKDIYDVNAADDRERRFWARQKMTEFPEAVDIMLEIHDLGADPLEGLRIYRDMVKKSKGLIKG